MTGKLVPVRVKPLKEKERGKIERQSSCLVVELENQSKDGLIDLFKVT